MKKKLLFSIVILLGVFALVGCSKDMTGKYKLVEMKEGKSSFTEKTLDQLGVKYILEVKKDGKATLKLGDEDVNLTYNDKYFTYKDDTKQKISYTLKDDKITMSQEGTSMTFKKIK